MNETLKELKRNNLLLFMEIVAVLILDCLLAYLIVLINHPHLLE